MEFTSEGGTNEMKWDQTNQKTKHEINMINLKTSLLKHYHSSN